MPRAMCSRYALHAFLCRTKRMTAEERALRLLTPQAKEFQRLRSGLEEYDANVEASVAAVGAATRAAAVQSNKYASLGPNSFSPPTNTQA